MNWQKTLAQNVIAIIISTIVFFIIQAAIVDLIDDIVERDLQLVIQNQKITIINYILTIYLIICLSAFSLTQILIFRNKQSIYVAISTVISSICILDIIMILSLFRFGLDFNLQSITIVNALFVILVANVNTFIFLIILILSLTNLGFNLIINI